MTIPLVILHRPLPQALLSFVQYRKSNSFSLTELQDLPEFEKSLLHPFIADLLISSEAHVEFGQYRLEVLTDALSFLKCAKTKPQKTLSTSTIIVARDKNWWLVQTSKNWRLQIADPMSLDWSEEEREWLTSWGFLGGPARANTSWTSLMHWEDTACNTDALDRTSASWRAPEFVDVSSRHRLPEQEVEALDLLETFEQRRSSHVAPRPASFEELARFFQTFLRSRAKSVPRVPYPSAGGLHQTHLFLEARHVDGLAAALYYYHPLEHELWHVGVAHERAGAATVLCVSAIDDLQLRYGSLAMKLALLNTGVLYHQIGLGLATVGLAGHAWGTLVEQAWKKQFKANWGADWKLTGGYEIVGGA